MEWVKRNTLKWFGHVEGMGSGEFVKVYESKLEGPDRRGRPLGRCKNRVREYLGRELLIEEEFLMKQGGRVGIGKSGDFCCSHPIGGTFPEGVRRKSYR